MRIKRLTDNDKGTNKRTRNHSKQNGYELMVRRQASESPANAKSSSFYFFEWGILRIMQIHANCNTNWRYHERGIERTHDEMDVENRDKARQRTEHLKGGKWKDLHFALNAGESNVCRRDYLLYFLLFVCISQNLCLNECACDFRSLLWSKDFFSLIQAKQNEKFNHNFSAISVMLVVIYSMLHTACIVLSEFVAQKFVSLGGSFVKSSLVSNIFAQFFIFFALAVTFSRTSKKCDWIQLKVKEFFQLRSPHRMSLFVYHYRNLHWYRVF